MVILGAFFTQLAVTLFAGALFVLWFVNRAWSNADPTSLPSWSDHVRPALLFSLVISLVAASLLFGRGLSEINAVYGSDLSGVADWVKVFALPIGMAFIVAQFFLIPLLMLWNYLHERRTRQGRNKQ